jgi:predicted RNA-binding Zn-ribbon protein involved in translation (DUF1610 family)
MCARCIKQITRDDKNTSCTCPICGDVREIQGWRVKRPDFTGVCNRCSNQNRALVAEMVAARRKGIRVEHIRRVAENQVVIRVNGCVLVPASSGRCADFIRCPHGSHAGLNVPREQDCLYQVAKRDWKGFRCRSEAIGKTYSVE